MAVSLFSDGPACRADVIIQSSSVLLGLHARTPTVCASTGWGLTLYVGQAPFHKFACACWFQFVAPTGADKSCPPWDQHPGHACACVAAFGFCIRPCVAAPLNNCPNFRPRPVTVWTRFDARPCPALLLLYKGGSGCGLVLAPSPPFSGVLGAACCLPPFLMAVPAAWPMAVSSLNVMAQASGAG